MREEQSKLLNYHIPSTITDINRIAKLEKENAELKEHIEEMLNAEVGEGVTYPSLYKPVIWVKSKYDENCQLMITGYTIDDEGKSQVWLTDSWITLEKLFDDFEFLNYYCCGVKVE